MSLEITGKIEKFLEVKKFPKKTGEGEWVTQDYIVTTDEKYNNLYCLNVFGEEAVENLTKYNNVGDNVKVQFNVNTREVEGKYYTGLSSWRIEKVEGVGTPPPLAPLDNIEPNEPDDLPF